MNLNMNNNATQNNLSRSNSIIMREYFNCVELNKISI